MGRATFEMIRDNYKNCCENGNPGDIAEVIAEQIGLCDEDGNLYEREDGFPMRNAKAPMKPSDFNLAEVTEAIIGRDWAKVLRLENSGKAFPFKKWLSEQHQGVREEASAAIGPSVMANVAAWSSTVGGLMQAQTLEGYQTADFDVADLFPTRPAIFWQGGERFIDIFGPWDPVPVVGPSEQHPAMSIGAMWVEPGPMQKYGASILIAKETAWIDITGGRILQAAKELGANIKFRENELALDIIVGQTQNFKLGKLPDTSATAYNTYGATITNIKGTSRTIPNDNVNPLNDIGALTNSDLYLSSLYHPFTDNPLQMDLPMVLLPKPMRAWAMWLNGVDDMTVLNQTSAGMALAAPGTFPNIALKGKNPYQNVLTPLVSHWLHVRQTASATQTDPNRSPGLGLTGSAIYRWYRLDPSKFAARRTAWEATVLDLNPSDFNMAMQNIIAGQVGNIAVQYQVMNPYAIQRNKSA